MRRLLEQEVLEGDVTEAVQAAQEAEKARQERIAAGLMRPNSAASQSFFSFLENNEDNIARAKTPPGRFSWR